MDAWLSVLETSGIIHPLAPYHSNFGKRLVKSPKLHFADTGFHFWRDSAGTEVEIVFVVTKI
jgi:predicted AAA+ superfamily ATPase